MIFFPFVIFRSRRQKSSDEFDSVHLNPPENKYFSYNLEFQEREFSFTRFFVRSTGIQIYIIHPPRVNRKYFSLGLERTNKRFHPFISIINFIITDRRWNSTFPPPEGTRKKLTIYVIRARTRVDSRSSGESTLPEAVMIGIADSRIGENTATLDVLTPRLLSFPRSFFAYAHDRNGKNAVDAAGRTPVSWTRSREGAAAAAGSVLSVNAGGFV